MQSFGFSSIFSQLTPMLADVLAKQMVGKGLQNQSLYGQGNTGATGSKYPTSAYPTSANGGAYGTSSTNPFSGVFAILLGSVGLGFLSQILNTAFSNFTSKAATEQFEANNPDQVEKTKRQKKNQVKQMGVGYQETIKNNNHLIEIAQSANDPSNNQNLYNTTIAKAKGKNVGYDGFTLLKDTFNTNGLDLSGIQGFDAPAIEDLNTAEDFDKEMDKVNKEIEDIQKKQEALNGDKSSNEDKNKALTQAIYSIDTDITALDTSIANITTRMGELSKSIQDNEAALNKLESQLNTSSSSADKNFTKEQIALKIEIVQQKIDVDEAEKKKLEAEKNKLEAQKKELEAQKKELEAQQKKLEDEKTQNTSDQDALKAANEILQDQLGRLELYKEQLETAKFVCGEENGNEIYRDMDQIETNRQTEQEQAQQDLKDLYEAGGGVGELTFDNNFPAEDFQATIQNGAIELNAQNINLQDQLNLVNFALSDNKDIDIKGDQGRKARREAKEDALDAALKGDIGFDTFVEGQKEFTRTIESTDSDKDGVIDKVTVRDGVKIEGSGYDETVANKVDSDNVQDGYLSAKEFAEYEKYTRHKIDNYINNPPKMGLLDNTAFVKIVQDNNKEFTDYISDAEDSSIKKALEKEEKAQDERNVEALQKMSGDDMLEKFKVKSNGNGQYTISAEGYQSHTGTFATCKSQIDNWINKAKSSPGGGS